MSAQVLVFHQTAKYTEDAVISVMEQFGAWQDSHPTWQVVQISGALAGGETWCSYALTVLFGVPEEQAGQGTMCPSCGDVPVAIEGRWCERCVADFEARR